jgi:hypothetical protein
MLEKDEEDQLDRSGEKEVRQSQSGEGCLNTINRRTANWIGYILRRNCLINVLWKERKKGGQA